MNLTLVHVAMVVFGMMMTIVAQAAPVDVPSTPTVVVYDCQVIVVAKDIVDGSVTFKYEVTPDNDGSHGGVEFPFSSGPHKVSVLSNGRWLGISWWRNDTLVSEAVFARSEENMGSQALIIYNPADQEEQASVDCSKR